MTELFYIYTTLHALMSNLLAIFSISAAVLGIICFFKMILGDDAKEDFLIAYKNSKIFLSFKISIISLVTLIIFCSFIPEEKNAYILSGLYLVEQTEGTDKLPQNVVKYLNDIFEKEVQANATSRD